MFKKNPKYLYWWHSISTHITGIGNSTTAREQQPGVRSTDVQNLTLYFQYSNTLIRPVKRWFAFRPLVPLPTLVRKSVVQEKCRLSWLLNTALKLGAKERLGGGRGKQLACAGQGWHNRMLWAAPITGPHFCTSFCATAKWNLQIKPISKL